MKFFCRTNFFQRRDNQRTYQSTTKINRDLQYTIKSKVLPCDVIFCRTSFFSYENTLSALLDISFCDKLILNETCFIFGCHFDQHKGKGRLRMFVLTT